MSEARATTGVKLESVRCSALSLGTKCPRSYRHSLSIPETSSHAASRGTMIHAMLARHLKGKKVNWKRWPAGPIVVDWLAEEGIGRPVTSRWVEASFRRTLAGVTLTGHSDVHYVNRAVDFKTGGGFHLPPIDEDYQGLGYSYLLHRRYGAKQVTFSRAMIDERRVDSCVHDFSDKLIHEALTELVHEMASPDAQLNPDPAGHCTKCWHRRSCPAYREAARPILGDDLLDALQAVDASPDIMRLTEHLPAAALVVDLAKELLPKKERAPRRKYKALAVLRAVVNLIMHAGHHSPGDPTSSDNLGNAVLSVSITAVDQLLRDNLNYDSEALAGFWADVEKAGGKV